MQKASDNGAVIMMHAETAHRHRRAGRQALARGETDPKYHGIVRRSELEGKATNWAVVLAKVAGNIPLYVVHVSASKALEALAAARHSGANVFRDLPRAYGASAPPHPQPGLEGAEYVCSPPIRTKPLTITRNCGRACARTSWSASPPTTARSA